MILEDSQHPNDLVPIECPWCWQRVVEIYLRKTKQRTHPVSQPSLPLLNMPGTDCFRKRSLTEQRREDSLNKPWTVQSIPADNMPNIFFSSPNLRKADD